MLAKLDYPYMQIAVQYDYVEWRFCQYDGPHKIHTVGKFWEVVGNVVV